MMITSIIMLIAFALFICGVIILLTSLFFDLSGKVMRLGAAIMSFGNAR